MKHFYFLILTALFLIAAGGRPLKAQETRLDASPQAFRQFFRQFRAAVEKNDRAAVASMTRFPFRYGFDAGDEGAMTRPQFVKRFAEIFGADPKRFLPAKNPLFSRRGGSYVVSTADAEHFIFVKSGGGFKFSAYMVEP
jgi:hypothetical protein